VTGGTFLLLTKSNPRKKPKLKHAELQQLAGKDGSNKYLKLF